MTYEEWEKEAKQKFGDDPLNWKFKCPSCKFIASVKDWRDAGAKEGAVAFSCVGRFTGNPKDTAKAAFGGGPGPCNYTGGGLIGLNPIEVEFPDGKIIHVFDFG